VLTGNPPWRLHPHHCMLRDEIKMGGDNDKLTKPVAQPSPSSLCGWTQAAKRFGAHQIPNVDVPRGGLQSWLTPPRTCESTRERTREVGIRAWCKEQDEQTMASGPQVRVNAANTTIAVKLFNTVGCALAMSVSVAVPKKTR
jgi:hypothetical protein